MLIAGLLCMGIAIACAALGLWSLSRPRPGDTAAQVTRSVAPTQLAAAVMLAAGGAVALAGPRPAGGVLVGVCVVGAVGTVAAGSWQSARYALRRQATPALCVGDCAACTLSCR
ncbi:hypothetical protein [Mycobacterium branderi]|uniref:Transmembrane protein n=1 Tax=Mycobacterium branderi TaxID=43348 RepID=A0A7I7W3X5_9MYCO|nr:hypothetical protein [Mycobacterium branderi]MCV7234970.1 hypothetical protein [Mycobacterium branderi]ORA36650.1 hypothetical protein BST20_15190 [Mycobacterium branderi]BBZ11401.1 hypothetical protein MBRA_15960 [Mycobacterium branderi]